MMPAILSGRCIITIRIFIMMKWLAMFMVQAKHEILLSCLLRNGRLSDALLYARAALRNFEAYAGRAGEMEEKTKRLIAQIEADIAKGKQ